MKKYIRLCIPEPFLTELTYWGCSCWPCRYAYSGVYSRINLRWQEVFTAYYEEPHSNVLSWHVAKSPFQSGQLAKLKRNPYIEVEDHRYKAGGTDQINIVALNATAAHQLLEDPTFLYAAKKFNLARMRSGAQPYAKYHSPALADVLLADKSG